MFTNQAVKSDEPEIKRGIADEKRKRNKLGEKGAQLYPHVMSCGDGIQVMAPVWLWGRGPVVNLCRQHNKACLCILLAVNVR